MGIVESENVLLLKTTFANRFCKLLLCFCVVLLCKVLIFRV